MRQTQLCIEDESERTHGSRQARLASEPEALHIRAILRHEPKYSDDVRSIECSDLEPERSGRSCVRPVDRQHLLDRLEYCQCVSHWSEPAGDSESYRPIRHLARTGRKRSL